ncbi:MAG: 2-succinyl-5-enolpyruvyl-6-hydroxy-3-cyclohexene-1-carboxylic-acid synthase [Acidimicrobiales bacterium]
MPEYGGPPPLPPSSADLPPLPSAPEDVQATYCATLVDQWAALGVRHAVVAPGSRSTPLAVALAAHDEIAVHVHLDERSAAFAAVGIGRATGVPAVVLTTSGTAATELHSAVVEAHQAGVPMIVCTADRPPELQGVHAPQTIRQTNLYGESVRWFVEPGPSEPEHAPGWRHLAADAWFASLGGVGHPPGPVHCNLAFREPLLGEPGELSPRLTVVRPDPVAWGLLDEQLATMVRAVGGRRVLVVAGARAALDDDDAAALTRLGGLLGWPILCDHLSGVRTPAATTAVTTFDAVLRVSEAADALVPEVVLHLGGLLASRVTNEWLTRSGAHHVGIDRWGMIPDPDHVLAEQVVGDVATICRQLLAHVEPAPPDWADRWADVEFAARRALLGELAGEPFVVDAAARAVPHDGHLGVSSSMPVRDLEWYGHRRDGLTVHSNCGANGIDGVTSTALGVALGSADRRSACWATSRLHDTNGLLGLARRDAPLCLVVIDNDGGGIFSFLPQADRLEGERFEELFGTPQPVDLAALIGAHGLDLVAPESATELVGALDAWAAAPRPLVVLERSHRSRNVADHRAINDAVRAAILPLVAD